MKVLFTTGFIFLLWAAVTAQDIPKEYYTLTQRADSLYKRQKYRESGLAYHAAFLTLHYKGLPDDRYNAACSWALANCPDSAFNQLFIIATRSAYTNKADLIADIDLLSLHKDPRWPALLNQVSLNWNTANAAYDKRLVEQIDSMVAEDQKWRGLYRRIDNKEVDTLLYKKNAAQLGMHVTDSLNYYLCKKIVSTYGFPNYKLVGENGSYDFWLLLQHQDLQPAFQDSALALMKIEVDKGLAGKSSYAYLMDRVLVNSNRPQLYGTQMQLNKNKTSYEPKPVAEPEKLNERRKAMGMGTIEEYTKTMNARYYGTLSKDGKR